MAAQSDDRRSPRQGRIRVSRPKRRVAQRRADLPDPLEPANPCLTLRAVLGV